MNKKLCLAVLALGIFATGVAFFSVNTQPAGASVGMEYSFKNVTSTNASSTIATTDVAVKNGFGTFGSLIIASSSGSTLNIYDGTASSTGTLIASFPASATVGTYTFDVAVSKGIVVTIPKTHNGNYTITYR